MTGTTGDAERHRPRVAVCKAVQDAGLAGKSIDNHFAAGVKAGAGIGF